MQKIIPCIWFENQAEEAAKFYSRIFRNSNIGRIVRHDASSSQVSQQPEGSVLTVEFEIKGYKFLGLNGGAYFKTNPSISFFINFDPSKDKNATDEIHSLWEKLSIGGKILMPLDKYPFSNLYGWVEDKFGISWQLILLNTEGEERSFIIPSFLFVNKVCGKADEAVEFYLSIFKNTKRGLVARYQKGMEPDKEGTVMFTDFMLEDQWFAAMDSAHKHDFNFNEAVSFMVNCSNQEEIDFFWNKLSYFPESQQCGWLKDKYGISWQIVPDILPKLLSDSNYEKSKNVMKELMQMKKINIDVLVKASQ